MIFAADPAVATEFPQDYLERVKKVHSEGGYGSQGYDAGLDTNSFAHRPLWPVGFSEPQPFSLSTGRSFVLSSFFALPC